MKSPFSVLPAYAGVIPPAALSLEPYRSSPRIRGGDPGLQRQQVQPRMFSPHTRG
ncbi:Hypothetical protein PFR_JS7-2_1903 [Propionibacterium freudenreichii]|nr:Hypothetical protein PFR_JS7-1_1961 [Propionibacterium freudenreichii]SCQ54419.1 Hypothetical protein PFR_JS7-2_1903 [Propionibacterium freudenreichii]